MIPQKKRLDVVPPFYKLSAKKTNCLVWGKAEGEYQPLGVAKKPRWISDGVWGYFRRGTGNRGCGGWGVGVAGKSMCVRLFTGLDWLDWLVSAAIRNTTPRTPKTAIVIASRLVRVA